MASKAGHLWVCPICGRQFRTTSKNHSCGVFALEDHFKRKAVVVREVYERLGETLNQFGTVAVYPVKTRIVFQVEVQFAAAITHKDWLEVVAWLKRPAAHARLLRIEMGVYRDYGHIFRLEKVEDLDEGLVKLLKEAYALGVMVE